LLAARRLRLGNTAVSTRCSQMQAEADMIEKKLRSSLEVELLKLPERVRSMPMSELLAKYDGNLSLAISSTPRRSSIRASGIVPAPCIRAAALRALMSSRSFAQRQQRRSIEMLEPMAT